MFRAMVSGPHEVRELASGVFGMLLDPCTPRVLPHLLRPEPESWVWVVAYHPHPVVEWIDLPLPLSADGPAERVRARLPRYDLQFTLPDFLERLPRLHGRGGLFALQMRQPVPDILSFEDLAADPDRHGILRDHGWVLSFDLPRDGEQPWIESPDREYLERLLLDPVIASRELP